MNFVYLGIYLFLCLCWAISQVFLADSRGERRYLIVFTINFIFMPIIVPIGLFLRISK